MKVVYGVVYNAWELDSLLLLQNCCIRQEYVRVMLN